MSDSEDDVVLAQRTKRSTTTKPKLEDDSDEDDVPLSQLNATSTTETSLSAQSQTSDDGDVPLAKQAKSSQKRKASSKPAQPKKRVKKEGSDEKKPKKSTSNGNTKASTNGDKKPKKEKTPSPDGDGDGDDDEDDGTYKWWEEQKDDDTIKWDTLEHNGVMFPPEYEPLPSHVKLYYDGKPVDLPLAAEEVAGFFGALLETDHGKNPVFQKNFFHDFLDVLKESGGCNVQIKEFEKCDFTKMHQYFELKKEEKKSIPASEKKRLRQEKEEEEAPYKICLLNGRKEQVGNFRVEPPGLFRGRGAHPRTGKLKRRVFPEDIILNLGKDAPVPPAPEGHKWAEVRHDNTVSWLAMWRENVLNAVKYVRFAANSSLKGMSDYKKFEKARELKYHIAKVREDYEGMLRDKLMLNRQIATATYLIDIFALRAGGEKSEDEADTVGCCSLRYEHITLSPPTTVVFDFLGKDSIRFYQEVQVAPQVFKNLKLFKKAPKGPGDQLFDRLDPSILNKRFHSYMPGLTAKVFRTYNASKTMQDQLDLIPNEGTPAEKVTKFNAANRTVAILCNHQRTVAKGHDAAMQKIHDKLKEMLWQKIRLKKMMLQIDKNLKKKKPEYFEELEDLSKEDELEIHKVVIERERDKQEKKFKRDNEKRQENKEELLPQSELKEALKKVDELEKEYKKEAKSGKPEVKPANVTVEKLEAQVEKLEQRITNTSIQMKDKEDNSEVSLSTSKINYIDPRLSVVFCKKFDVPIEKIFTKTLREKFKWAIESVDENWRF
ncbi:DNA topoisomerase I [Wickerhamomyces ciferrii]|uniref:DNA topoisomerase I n=1 Tax=Wickerhamomyces ciferrii (strain ATCC 14091 / BCRC 22168 / CBS 111 / JCM 3599 / NBRC 0793 / NRRL Y-1031 F-60-10) TaxID=1206466 RepID=K0KLD2_WICCF|nr:DNA topoisomerase I [Wickerhamomyces ciferrii]CCH41928.1 DNA topoisomerase I [Wickerhamomyces ciferrii]